MKIPHNPLFRSVIIAAVFATSACNSERGHGEPEADIIFTNGTVYTADEQRSIAESVAVTDGRISFVGSEAEAVRLAGEKTLLVDMREGMLLPGFTDAHVHLAAGGHTLNSLALYEAASPEEIESLVRDYIVSHPELDVIVGAGWQLTVFAAANPDKAMLDAIEATRPVILESADGHNAWVNTRALELAGIGRDTPEPENGRIERDPVSREPTGTLREAAVLLVAGLIPAATVEASLADLQAGQAFQNGNGFTAAIDAAVTEGISEDAFVLVAQQGGLSLRTDLSLLPSSDFTDAGFDPAQMAERIRSLQARRERINAAGSPYLTANSVKIFLDGVLENHTGALLEPYLGSPEGPDYRGKLNIPEEILKPYVTQLDAAGFDVHMHAIGDRAVRAGLDSAAAAAEANGPRDRRIHIAHLQLLDPEDIPRFAALGVYANLQTLWATASEYITDLTEPFLGPQRSQWLYPNRSLRDSGAVLVSGSDWPVSTSNPFLQMEVAVTRQDPREEAGQPWLPDQTLAVEDMIDALTINGAKLMRQDGMRGSIETGKAADLVLVSGNPLRTPARDLGGISIRLTMLDGREVYRAEDF